MLTKYKTIEDFARSYEKLSLFPKTLLHDMLDYDGKWKKETKPWVFSLTVDDILHKYRISYSLLNDMDEIIQYLPIPEDEIKEAQEIGYYGSYTGGFIGDNLDELIDSMYEWLKNECCI